ncbi:cell wall-binding repeat-containing protein [Desulfosporosinus sp. PR]|uniref:cell wall-binding repeat-containing protein n=1 Tax=Candidatus Desulfosporosinus nitrosoreducens TaxID=3401928 RepID=UPI0027FAB5B9|nr:cell wall-binding repeat-containing protein [Desulfosporosinus sp. PR]MDQ7093413.1 cell wall-binding repeat-containing protein [Desulfosporosinus sp. PR]
MKKKLASMFLALIFTASSALPALAATSTTTISPTINRISGQDRYETSAAIAERGWPNGSANCILAFGGGYTDSLAAAPLAKKYDAPILLTESASLTPVTKQTLIDLKTKNVTIVGGTGVISASVDAELQAMGITTTRVFGNDKYETSIAVAKQVTSTPLVIFVCTADDFSDALSISPIASIKKDPIILVSKSDMPESVKDYLSDCKNIVTSYVIGSTEEIDDTVAGQFPNVERISGADSYGTNIAVNKEFATVFNPNTTTLASGEQFPDALSGSTLATKLSAPIVLVNNDSPSDTKIYYQQRIANAIPMNNSAPNVYVFGGPAVVSDDLLQNLSQPITVSHLSSVNVTTTAGNAPVLPSTLTATMSDGTTQTVNVTWATVTSNQYNVKGAFLVLGTILESTTVKATATVTVVDANTILPATVDQVQQDILGTWKTSDGKYTLEFKDDGTLVETQILTGYTTVYNDKYSFPNPTLIKLENSNWAEEDNFALSGRRLEIFNLGITRIAGNSSNTINPNDYSYPVSLGNSSSDSFNYVFLKVD